MMKRINNTKTSDVHNLLPWNIDLNDSQVAEAIEV